MKTRQKRVSHNRPARVPRQSYSQTNRSGALVGITSSALSNRPSSQNIPSAADFTQSRTIITSASNRQHRTSSPVVSKRSYATSTSGNTIYNNHEMRLVSSQHSTPHHTAPERRQSVHTLPRKPFSQAVESDIAATNEVMTHHSKVQEQYQDSEQLDDLASSPQLSETRSGRHQRVPPVFLIESDNDLDPNVKPPTNFVFETPPSFLDDVIRSTYDSFDFHRADGTAHDVDANQLLQPTEVKPRRTPLDHIHNVYDRSDHESKPPSASTQVQAQAAFGNDDPEAIFNDLIKEIHQRKIRPKDTTNDLDSDLDTDDDDDDDSDAQSNSDSDAHEIPVKIDEEAYQQRIYPSKQWQKRIRPLLRFIENNDYIRAAEGLLKLAGDPHLEVMPKQVYSLLIAAALPYQPSHLGVPLTASDIRPGASPFISLIIRTATERGVRFSDVEWSWVLNAIAQSSSPTNRGEVRKILEQTIAAFRKAEVYHGFLFRRNRSLFLQTQPRDPSFTRRVALSAPHVSLIEQRAWAEYYNYSRSNDVLLAFRKIHDSVVFKPDYLAFPSFIVKDVEEDILSRDTLDAEAMDDKLYTRYINPENEQVTSDEKVLKQWVTDKHHPNLFNYTSSDDLPYLAYMAAPDDILSEPWMYQPPHFKQKFLPRMSPQYRDDSTVFFPTVVTAMNVFTSAGTANVEQAEKLYKHILTILMNTEGYTKAITAELRVIDEYRTLHGYQPEEDSQMAQNMEAPQGEEFRYLAGYPLLDGMDYIKWRRRATFTIMTLTKMLTQLYKSEKRPGSISKLIEFLLDKKRQYPALIPTPSLGLMQSHLETCIQAQDIKLARHTVEMIQGILGMFDLDTDPMMLLSVQALDRKKRSMAKTALKRGEIEIVPGTTRQFMEKHFFSKSHRGHEWSAKMAQASFYSLRTDVSVTLILARAAMYSITNNFTQLVQLLADEALVKNDVTPLVRSKVYASILTFLSTAALNSKHQLRIGSYSSQQAMIEAKTVHDKVSQSPEFLAIDQLTEIKDPNTGNILTRETPHAFEDAKQSRRIALIRKHVKPVFDKLLVSTPMDSLVSPSSLIPGHILWLIHQSQRQGGVLSEQLLADGLHLLSLFPVGIGSYASYYMMEDIHKLGFPMSNRFLNSISQGMSVQADGARQRLRKMYTNTTINRIYNELDRSTVTLPQLLDHGATAIPYAFHKEFSFLHPATIISYATRYNIMLDSTSLRQLMNYYIIVRDWKNVADIYRKAMDIAYHGDYQLVKSLCFHNNIPLSTFTDSLPNRHRRIVFQIRRSTLLRASQMQNHLLVLDIVRDWESSEDITLLPTKLKTVRSLNLLGFTARHRVYPENHDAVQLTKTIEQEVSESESEGLQATDDHKNDTNDQSVRTKRVEQYTYPAHLLSPQECEARLGQLPSTTQQLITNTLREIMQERFSPISLHYSLKRQISTLRDVFDTLLLSQNTKGYLLQRRFMERIGVGPNFFSITKMLSHSTRLATVKPFIPHNAARIQQMKTRLQMVSSIQENNLDDCTNAVSLLHNNPSQQSPSKAEADQYKTYITTANHNAALLQPSAATMITSKTSPIGVSVDYDIPTEDAVDILQNPKTNHAVSNLLAILSPTHFDNLDEHTLSIKLAAQRLLDHYEFDNVNDALHLVGTTRLGLADFGVEYEHYRRPIDYNMYSLHLKSLVSQSPLESNELQFDANSFMARPRILAFELQRHQLSYQNKSETQHRKLIFPLSLMVSSPALSLVGLKYNQPRFSSRLRHDVDEDDLSRIDPSYYQKKKNQLSTTTSSQQTTPQAQSQHVTTKFKPVEQYTYMTGSEHIDSVLAELYWRQLYPTPFHFNQIITEITTPSPFAPMNALMAVPYYAALTSNMNVFPLLDSKNRANHPLSTVGAQKRGDIEVEERLIRAPSNDPKQNELMTLNKINGPFTMYQHEAINTGLHLADKIFQQLPTLLHKIEQNVGNEVYDSQHEIPELHQGLNTLVPLVVDHYRSISTVLERVIDYLPPPTFLASSSNVSTSLHSGTKTLRSPIGSVNQLPFEKPSVFPSRSTRYTPKPTNYTESAITHTNPQLYQQFISHLKDLPTQMARAQELLWSDDISFSTDTMIFTPRVLLSNHQFDVIFSLLLRYHPQDDVAIATHCKNWGKSMGHLLSTFDALIHHVKQKDDPNTAKSERFTNDNERNDYYQRLNGMIDIIQQTLPTSTQLEMMKGYIQSSQSHKQQQQQQQPGSQIGTADNTNDDVHSAFEKSVNTLLMKSVQSHQKFQYLLRSTPVDIQMVSSTYLNFCTLPPVVYVPNTDEEHSKSLKSWTHEALCYLQSIRLAPDQLAAVSNTLCMNWPRLMNAGEHQTQPEP